MFNSILRFFAICITLCLGLVSGASAHEIRPAIADLYVSDGDFRMEITLSLEAIIAEISAGETDSNDSENASEYDQLRGLSAKALESAFDAEAFADNVTVTLDGVAVEKQVSAIVIPEIGDIELSRDSVVTVSGPLGDATVMQVGWDAAYGQIIIRLIDGDVEFDTFLIEGQISADIPVVGGEAQSFGTVLVEYIFVGFDHIIPKGLDHILFVIGLFLLSTRLHALLWQITAFTLAHSVTLGLTIMGVISFPDDYMWIVESLIAASIVYVCIENIFLTHLSKWRPMLIFAFGLLHGLGFAGALTEFGLTQSNLVPGLIGFNVGVEVGQICVILVCFFAVGLWFSKRSWYRAVVTIPASLVIAFIGAYWVIERTVGF